MFTAMRRNRKRAHRAKDACAYCGEKGTLEHPLMFVAETNRYWHYPDCMPVDEVVSTQAEKEAVLYRQQESA